MVELHRLGFLRELAARGTVTAVAEALAYSPSAVSQQLATLEAEVGVDLLERRGRGVVLTAAGRALVGGTDAVFCAAEQATSAAQAAASRLVGPVRIGSYPSVGATVVPATVAPLRAQEPDLELSYQQMADDGLRQLTLGHLDIWIDQLYTALPAPATPGVVARQLLVEPVCLAVPDRHDRGPDLRDYADAVWVGGTAGSSCHRLLHHLCDDAGFEPDVPYVADDLEVILQFVASGVAAAVLPRLAMTRVPDAITVHPLEDQERQVVALTRESSLQRPAVALVLEALTRAGANTNNRRPEPSPEIGRTAQPGN